LLSGFYAVLGVPLDRKGELLSLAGAPLKGRTSLQTNTNHHLSGGNEIGLNFCFNRNINGIDYLVEFGSAYIYLLYLIQEIQIII
jgi:hypothetical protein